MHDELWAGIALKLENARFHFEKMGQSLEPPERTHMNVALQSAGAIVDTRWQRSFYAYLDAFLSTTRSVAEVIQCCFGHDIATKMHKWFKKLPSDEQDRRLEFSKQFKKDYNAFAKLPLSEARHISEHRTGYADVTVAINEMLGVIYTGGPTKAVPISETREIDDPNLAFLAKPRPIHPTWADFQIDGQDLLEACDAHLGYAQDFINVAQRIAQQVHGNKTLTPPILK
jgi:hypothetical protein